MDPLRNYFELRDRVDALCRQIESAWRESLACRRGCDACCRHLTLFRVEGAALARALESLPTAQAEAVRERARRASAEGPCPLLEEGACLLYAARPLICRTHGLPLLTGAEGERRIDFCPENFRGVDSLPSSAVIDLERLNTALAVVERLYAAEVFGASLPDPPRLTIAESLLSRGR